MADPKHLRILEQGVKAFNVWREDNPYIVSNLVKADLSGADLSGVNLSGANLRAANLKGVNLVRADLKQVNLIDARLSWANLKGVDLSRADLSRANINGVNLSGADLSEADLRGAHLSTANLIGTDLSRANLRGVYLRGADLCWVHLNKARLNMADLREAQLREADLSEACLGFADLRGAHLKSANFREAQLRKANLKGADLSKAQFKRANLRGADLSGANLKGADLRDADLRQAIFDNTIITSRTVLTLLRFALTDEQKSFIIYSDEKEIEKKKSNSNKLKKYQHLTIEFHDEVSWKNEWLAFLLLSIQTTYNNCFYLSRTEDKDIKIIKKNLERKCQVSAQNDIELKLIQQHSPLIIQYVQYAIENVPQVATVLSTLAELICVISKSFKTFTEGKNARDKSQKKDARIREIQIEAEKNSFALALRQTGYISEIRKKLQKDLDRIAISTMNDVVLRDTGKLLFLASKNLLIVLGVIKETANIGDILVKIEKS
jgi:uncharacterized protein YjbI with pentapeptide repeats